MSKLAAVMEKVFPLTKNMYLPGVIFGLALLSFYIKGTMSISSILTWHTAFYVLNFVSTMILLYYNQSKGIFFILCATLGYILINFLKNKYGAAYLSSVEYNNLCVLLPLNLILFYFLPNRRLLCKENVYLLLAVFIQYSIVEQLSIRGINLNFSLGSTYHSGLNNLALLFFILAVAATFYAITANGSIWDYSLFFANLGILSGVYYSDSPTALSIFFGATSLTVLIAIIQNIYYSIYKDTLTGFASRNAFIIHSKNFPLKYSIGLVSIDDFDKLATMFGRRNQNSLLKMVTRKITDLAAEDNIYRYSENEFVIIFKNEDKNESFTHLEEIRRAVAAASFVLNPRRNPLKITISASVSEKKRSDANHIEVLVRARKILQKTRSFSHNVTSKA